MFKDSDIANKFQMGCAKLAYILNFGIAPYLKSLLVEEVKKSDWYVVCFDESLNDVLQTCQMDVNVRFRYNDENRVETRYWDSKFLWHTTAQHILENFCSALDNLKQDSVVEMPMDGPSTNMAFYNSLKLHREKEELPQLIDICSCRLRIIHGAFKAGTESTGWKEKETLNGHLYCYMILLQEGMTTLASQETPCFRYRFVLPAGLRTSKLLKG